MKILHCADIHLDSPMNRLREEDKKQRNSELCSAFAAMIDEGRKKGVEAVIIAGDLFDQSRVSRAASNTVLAAINRNSSMDFYYLKGNHDKNDFLSDDRPLPSNLHLFNDDWTYYELGENILLAGAELNSGNAAALYSSLDLDTQKFNIVTLHGQDSDSSAGDGVEIVSLKDLSNRNIDYLALGHIHGYKAGRLDGRGIYCYPGCLEPRGFDETQDHGYIIIDINEENGRVSYEKCLNPIRLAHEEQMYVTGLFGSAEIIDAARAYLSGRGISYKDYVKLVITGELSFDCEKNNDFIEKQLKNDFFDFSLKDKTKLMVNFEDYRLDESLKGEFVRTVEGDDGLTDEDKAAIIRLGIMALKGEELG